jgi:large subunit ribosomal protein L17
MSFKKIHEELKAKNSHARPQRLRAGQTVPGDTRAALDLAQGALGHRRPLPRGPILDMKTVFGRKYR